jgi:predicted deacetylase
MIKSRQFLFSVHDVAPFHLEKLYKAEELIEEYKIPEVCFLVVPDFHGQGASDVSREFVSWTQKNRSYNAEWFLHGYYHQEMKSEVWSERSGFVDKIKRRFLTEGEGEFLGLKTEIIRERLTKGKTVYKNLFGTDDIYGFVAPAWLFKKELIPCLAESGVSLTEDHRYLYDVKNDTRMKCPVITWATRTPLVKYGSLVVCPLLVRLWGREPLIRIAVHPSDFAHKETVDNIRRVLDRVTLDRTAVGYRGVEFEKTGDRRQETE